MATPDMVPQAGLVTFMITAKNLGPADVSSVNVTNLLPRHVLFVNASDGGVYDQTSNSVSFHTSLESGQITMIGRGAPVSRRFLHPPGADPREGHGPRPSNNMASERSWSRGTGPPARPT